MTDRSNRSRDMDRRAFLGSLAAFAAGCGIAPRGPDVAGPAESPGRTALPTRPLGRTGLRVTVLAIGGVAGMKRRPAPDFDPAALAEAALDAGIRYFDTAPAYGGGRSERNYGEVLARRRGEVFLATKTDRRSYDGAMRQVETSLERLRTDHVDLLQIHGARAREDLGRWGRPDGVLRALRTLRDQKVTRLIGVTGHEDADVMCCATSMYEFDTILTTFNPTGKRRPFREKLLPLARRKEMGILVMKVMGGGLGSLARGRPIHNDGASNHDEAPRQADASQLVRYALGLPVTAAIVGMRSLEELRVNVHAARDLEPLDEAGRRALEAYMAG